MRLKKNLASSPVPLNIHALESVQQTSVTACTRKLTSELNELDLVVIDAFLLESLAKGGTPDDARDEDGERHESGAQSVDDEAFVFESGVLVADLLDDRQLVLVFCARAGKTKD